MNNFIKLTIVAIFSVILAMPAEAKRVEPEKAKKLAQNFVESKRGPWVKADIRLKHTAKKRKQKHEKEETALYYVFNVNEAQGSGFVIVAGDDAVKAVLGYSDSGNYDENNVPTNFAYWMDFLGEQIAYAQEQELAYSGQYSGQYDHDYGQPNGWVAVSPLIQTQWNQSAPYNNKTPVHSGQQTVTGCVATAMAQIMKYWNHPMKGTGSSTAYTTTTNSISVPSVNFAATTYDWSNMLDKYSSTATTPQNDAVATLMYHAGVSVQMDYGQSSGAQNARIAPALRDNFGYDNSIQQLFRSNYSNTAWDAMLEAEIDAGRPVYYAGSNANEGHAFILDGYDNTDKFHFNWGWGGKYDGYFVTTALNPGTGGIGAGAGTYNLNQTIIINIKPKNANAPPTITSPPSNRTVQAGNTAQFTVAATPTGALSYQWQVSKNTVATRDTIVREDFEGTNSFTVINGTQTNKWHVGTAAVYGGTKSAYISNNNGTSNALTATSSIVHMYKDVTFPVFEACTLWLYRKGKADANNNYLSIRLVETSVTPTAGSTPGGAYNYFTTSYDNWVLSYYVVPQSNSGTTKRLVFTWQNDGSGINPPIAMDNILMIATVLESGESPFSNVSDGTGGTTATYTTPTATRAMSGYRYRSIVKSNNGLPATSQIATLTVTGAITGHPSNRTVNAGEQAQFTTTAAPSGVTYQWQVSKNIVEAKETLVDENFEGSSSSFTLVNGSQTNQWAIGTAAAYGGTKSAYISNNNGTSNALTTTSSIVHMYKDVTFPVFEACTLWFYRKGKADANNNLTLRLVETSVTPTAGSTPSGTYQNFNSNQDNWSRAYYVVPQSNSGTTKRLVLTWKNDNTGANPPYAIDNILIVATVCVSVL
jgi:Peptidase C10 family.